MAITRLKRKGRKNKLRVKVRAQKLKLESFKPVIKQVDIEEIKEGFKNAPKKAAKPEKVKEVEVEASEAPAEASVATVSEEKPAAKKATATKKAAVAGDDAPKKKVVAKAKKDTKE